jgi:spore coat polysaccharide biosynthesis protein SpsF
MKTPSTHIIIQARMGSSRLPGKILKPFIGGYTPLSWLIARAQLSKYASKVIVATSTNPKDGATEAAARAAGAEVYRGSEDDVLQRMHETVVAFDTKIICDVTGDEPLVDVAEVDHMVEILVAEHMDYLNNHPTALPSGAGAQVFTRAAFDRVAAEAHTPYDHEHVTPYFYHHPELFKQRIIEPLAAHPFGAQVRMDLDTAEDLEFLTTLAKSMGFTKPEDQPTTNEILDYLQAHPELVAINKEVVQKTFPKA